MDDRTYAREPTKRVDVLVLTAVQDELEAIIALADGWTEARDGEGYRLFMREFTSDRGKPFTVAAAWIGEMGKQSAAIRGKQLLDELAPMCLAMCGVCAGYRKEVALGDVIVADQIWAADEGKRVVEPGKSDVFHHSLRTFDLPSTWKMDAAFLAREFDLRALSAKRPPQKDTQLRWILHTLHAHETLGLPAPMAHPDRVKACPAWTDVCRHAQALELIMRKGASLALTDRGRDAVDADLVDYPDGLPANPPMRVHIGAIATVSALEKDPAIFERLRLHVRNTIALEMEGSAIGDLARRFERRSILVKAVQDFADGSKDDSFRHFACEAAATFLLAFLKKHLELEVVPAPREKRHELRDFEREREDPFLIRVEQIAALHHASAKITWHPAEAPFSGILELEVDNGGYYETHVVAAIDKPITTEIVRQFADREKPFRDRHPFLRSTIVHQGEAAPRDLREDTFRRLNTKLTTFREYQGLFDLTQYLQWQTARLESNHVYPPRIYVDPPATYEVSGSLERHRIDNALRFLWDLLASPDHRRFALVLGEFGAGKTFLLRELCRRMVVEKHPVWPVLVQMDKLEKRHDLPTLLAAHFAQADVPGFNFKAFQYMLNEGRIALLFDGFDELADRVTYDTVTAHFDTVLSAARGSHAKVVLSSRRQHFLSEAQVKLDLARRAEMMQGFHMMLLLRFEELQIRQYLQNVLGSAEAAKERYALIDDIKDLLGLSHNPRMLGFIVGIPEASLREAKLQQGTITAAGLYDLLVTQWLDGEYDRERRRSTLTGISRKGLGQGMTALALSMWQARLKTVDVKQIRDVLADAMRLLGEPALDPEIIAHLFAAGSLLVRDADARFSFVHRSVMEWLVAREAAQGLLRDEEPAALEVDEMSPLMADFFSSMAGRARAVAWARGKLFGAEKGIAAKNATLVLQRLGESFERVDFAGQDLRGRDFSGADWRGADLRGTNLEGATLVWTNLSGANLEGARLVRANLTEANLEGARLGGADLRLARLLKANLSNCIGLDSAKLFRTNLAGAKVPSTFHTTDVDPFGTPAVLGEAEPVCGAPSAACSSVAFNITGDLVAGGFADGTVRVFDAATGEVLRVLVRHTLGVRSVAFSPDGKSIASGSDDNSVRLWDIASGRELRSLEGHVGYVWSVAFSPDGETIASGSQDRTIRVWDVTSGEPRSSFDGHHHAVVSVAWSPDGKTVVSGSSDKTLRLWDVASGLCVGVIEGHNNAVLSVAWSPDGKTIASGSSDKTLRLWDIASRCELRSFEGHEHAVYSVVYSPDGKTIVSGSSDKTVRIWDVAAGRKQLTIREHAGFVRSVAFSPDGSTVASASYDFTLRLWDVSSGRSIRSLEGHLFSVVNVVVSPDGNAIATIANDNMLRLWNGVSGRLLYAHQAHPDYIVQFAFTSDGTAIGAGIFQNLLYLWDVATGHPLWNAKSDDWIITCALSSDGQFIASASNDGNLRLLDVKSGQVLRTLEYEKHIRSPLCIAVSATGRTIVSSFGDHTLKFWNTESTRLRPLEGPVRDVLSIAFSHDGKTVAASSADSTVRLWNVGSGKVHHTLNGHTQAVLSVAFGPDGNTIASGSADNTVRLWDAASGHELRCLRGHSNSVVSVAFALDGKSLISGSYDNTLRLWDVATGLCVALLFATTEGWVAFTPDGRYKFGGNLEGSFWHIVGLCRFEVGEIDAFLPHLRIPDDDPLFPL